MIQHIVLNTDSPIQHLESDQIICAAIKCLENSLRYDAQPQFSNSEIVSNFLRLQGHKVWKL